MQERADAHNWPVLKLEQCVEILDHLRKPLNSQERAARRGNVPYYGATGLIDHVESHIFDDDLVLLGEDAAPFFDKTRHVAYLISGPAWVNNHAHVLKPRPEVVRGLYLKYYLDFFDYAGRVGGSTRDKLTQGAMRTIPVPVPGLHEQDAIVRQLSQIDQRTATCIASLTSARQWIQEFETAVLTTACTGQLTAAWRATVGNESSTQDEPRMSSSEYREVSDDLQQHVGDISFPKSYRLTTLGTIAASITYGTSKKAARAGGVPVLRMGNIQNGRIDTSDLKYIAADEVPEELLLLSGDLLFNRTNSPELVGKSAVYDNELQVTFASYLLRVRLDRAQADPQYVALWLNSRWGRRWAQHVKVDGVGQSNINSKKLKAMPLPLPPIQEQVEIVRMAGELLSLSDGVRQRISRVEVEAVQSRINASRNVFGAVDTAAGPQEHENQVIAPEVAVTEESTRQPARRVSRTSSGGGRGRTRASGPTGRRDLLDVLQERGRGMSPRELLETTGYSVDDIDDFYLMLRAAVDSSLISEQRTDQGEPILVALPLDAQRATS